MVEVVKEAARDAISVRFTGMIREEMDAVPQAFDEVWHLTKPHVGGAGWQLSGIEQMQ